MTLVLVPACSGNGSVSDEALLLPSGAELGDEFVVPEGASLVGARFPGRVEGSWDALLHVEGDPFEVLTDLADQAEALGLTLRTSNTSGAWCAKQAALLECDLYAVGESPPRSYAFAVRWGRAADDVSYSHLLVRRDPDTLASALAAVDGFDSDAPAPPDSLDTWQPPTVGAEVAETTFPGAVVKREAGSALIAPAGPSWCITGGYTVVLRLEDDADSRDVVSRYVQQFEAFGFEGETTAGFFEEKPYLAAFYDTAGGGELEAVALGDDPRLLLLSRCNN